MTDKPRELSALVVDDHQIVRLGLAQLLQRIGCVGAVDQASDGREALEALRKRHYDVVLMDVKMPVMDGIAATRAIAAQHPRTRVIAMSVFDDEVYINGMLANGAKGYILKNTDQEELERALHTVMNGNRHLPVPRTDSTITKTRTKNAWLDLSDRERDVLHLIVQGMRTKAVARQLLLSVKTVEASRARLFEKTNSTNVVELVRFAFANGLVDPPESVSRVNAR